MDKALALNPRNSSLATSLSETYETLRRYPQAMRFIDIAISLAPDVTTLNGPKALLQVKVDGNTRAARDTLRKVDPREDQDLPWLEVYMDILDGRNAEALDRLAKIPSDVLDNQSFYFPKPLQAGLIHLATNDGARARVACESARQVLEKEIAKSPRDPRVRTSLGMALACLGRKEEAVREARLAADISPVSSDALAGPQFLETLASVYAMVGDSDAAIDLLDRLLAMPSGTAVTLLKLDPAWKPLWKLPRFQKLMEKYE